MSGHRLTGLTGPFRAMIGLTRGSKQSRYSDSYWRPVLRL